MVSGTILGEYSSAAQADTIWKSAFLDGHKLLPKILPGIISSIEILEGDGAAVGTVRKTNFTDANKDCRFVEDRVEVMDRENHTVKYCILDGGVLGVKVKSYSVGFRVASMKEGGCLVKIEIVYESNGESLLPEEDANDLKQGILSMLKAVDAYLVASPDTYA